jgi:hypothetical protein
MVASLYGMPIPQCYTVCDLEKAFLYPPSSPSSAEVLNPFGKAFNALDVVSAGLALLILQKASINVAASGIERHREQKAQLKAI